MTVRSILLIAFGLWPALVSQAQTVTPPAVEEPQATKVAEVDSPAKLRQMQEDVTVFRVLFNRSASRYYNLPSKPRDLIHAPPSAEGVYLKGQGVVITCGLPQPSMHPLKKAGAAQAENSPWDRVRLELRGEKPVSEAKPTEGSRQSLSEHLLALLAENGHHFSKLADQDRVTIAVTLRAAQDCNRCHDAAGERRTVTGPAGGGGGYYRMEPPKPVPVPPSPSPMGGSGLTPPLLPGGSAPRDEENIDIQIGDLAMKQKRFNEAEEAYMRIIQRLSGNKEAGDVRRLILLAEVSSKLAQCELALGQGDKARQALLLAQYSEAAVALTEKGKEKTTPPPAQLILSATKAQLDQVAGRKISFEEFSKAATVEYRAFDAPEEKKEGTK